MLAIHVINLMLITRMHECINYVAPLRSKLDYGRLEDAHLKFCMLNVCAMYPSELGKFQISGDLTHSLEQITPIYYEAMRKKYSGTYILKYVNIYYFSYLHISLFVSALQVRITLC